MDSLDRGMLWTEMPRGIHPLFDRGRFVRVCILSHTKWPLDVEFVFYKSGNPVNLTQLEIDFVTGKSACSGVSFGALQNPKLFIVFST